MKRGNWSTYEFPVIEKHQSYENINGRWGKFIVGGQIIHHLSTPQFGSEEMASITWALKSDCPSPLHFWAAATLIVNAFDLEMNLHLTGSTFFYRQNHSAIETIHGPTLAEFASNYWAKDWRPMRGRVSYMPNVEAIVKHDWAHNQPPLPAAVNEKTLRSWPIQDNWNDQSTLFETEEHFILWNWSTGA